MSPAPATITDVARAADVSPATVSRVLNGTTAVSEARAERVRAAAATLGYRPFEPARALRRQLTRVWAAIIADIENPFFTAMVRGIEDVARAEGFRLVLCNSDEDLDNVSGGALGTSEPPEPDRRGRLNLGLQEPPEPDKTKPGFTEPPEPIKIGH